MWVVIKVDLSKIEPGIWSVFPVIEYRVVLSGFTVLNFSFIREDNYFLQCVFPLVPSGGLPMCTWAPT